MEKDSNPDLLLEENQIFAIVHPDSTKGDIRFWDGNVGWSSDLKSSFRAKDVATLKASLARARIKHPIAVPVILTVRTEPIIDPSGQKKWQVLYNLKSVELS